VRTGLTLILVGTGLLLPGLLGLVYADVLWGSEVGRPRANTPDLLLRRSLQTLLTVALLIGAVQAFTGLCLGCAAPEGVGAKGPAILATVPVILTLLLIVFAPVLLREAGPTGIKAFFYGLWGLGMLSALGFGLFLRGTARAFGSRQLAVQALFLLIVTLLVGAGNLAYSLVTGPLEAASPAMILGELERQRNPFRVARLVASLVLALWTWVLVFLVRGTITRGLTARR
jgi:hypothetical protein